jgi:hypothetical protein
MAPESGAFRVHQVICQSMGMNPYGIKFMHTRNTQYHVAFNAVEIVPGKPRLKRSMSVAPHVGTIPIVSACMGQQNSASVSMRHSMLVWCPV